MTTHLQHQDRPADPETVVQDFLAAGKLALETERWGEAASTLQAALELCGRTPGLERFSLDILEKLAVAVQRASGAAEALPVQRRLVSLYEAARPTDPRYPAVLVSLGFLYNEVGRTEEASKQVDRAVAIVEGGDDQDPGVVAAATSIGNVLCHRGEFPEAAERMLRKGRAGLSLSLGRDDPEAASFAIPLAQLAMQSDRDEEALALLEEALPALEEEQPPRARLGQGLMFLGQLRMDAERHDEAVALFERAEAIYHRILGPDSLEALGCLFQRGLSYQELGQAEQAEAIFRRALQGVEAALGEDHEAVANIAEAYAELLDSLDRHEEAEALKARVIAIRRPDEI